MPSTGLRIVVVGLRFGSGFIPIYRAHPDVAEVAICSPDAAELAEVGARHGVERRFATLDQALSAPDIDAVHLVTPVPLHARQSEAALDAGKHVACAVPMGLSLDELARVIAASERSRRRYMMMETAAYGAELLLAQRLLREGVLGRLQLMRGSHTQDLENYADYWRGFPPMLYATHAVAPALKLSGRRALSVSCLGSGGFSAHARRAGDAERWHNPWPAATMIVRLDGGLALEVTRTLFDTAIGSREHFDVHGDAGAFVWSAHEGQPHTLLRLAPIEGAGAGRRMTSEAIVAPPRPDLLPSALARFADGGHGGSHPHLVHEFVSAIREEREPAIGARAAADWCAPGIVAHASALAEGRCLEVPSFGGIPAAESAA